MRKLFLIAVLGLLLCGCGCQYQEVCYESQIESIGYVRFEDGTVKQIVNLEDGSSMVVDKLLPDNAVGKTMTYIIKEVTEDCE